MSDSEAVYLARSKTLTALKNHADETMKYGDRMAYFEKRKELLTRYDRLPDRRIKEVLE